MSDRRDPHADPSFAERIVAWQKQHGRHALPWQSTRDPYRVWLSEIMLQQTQVATVLAYYERFIARFPDVRALAAADARRRARGRGAGSATTAARATFIAARRSSSRSTAARSRRRARRWRELPGIGRSTAAAIAAFCFGERVAILDGNVKRVLARVLAFEGDLAEARAERELWARSDGAAAGARHRARTRKD